MSLVADYSATSSSCSSESEECEEAPEKSAKHVDTSSKSQLPSANSLLTKSKSAGEVFQNRFQQVELAKKATLEHHVKMVESDEHLKMKNGRKICWNYRKGRCRFGSKCQYAHDSDLTATAQSADRKLDSTSETSIVVDAAAEYSSVQSSNNNKRKRHGLGDSITPGKRVLNAYSQQKKHKT